jgi:hypothetical protein
MLLDETLNFVRRSVFLFLRFFFELSQALFFINVVAHEQCNQIYF